jgi:hypothetical protein
MATYLTHGRNTWIYYRVTKDGAGFVCSVHAAMFSCQHHDKEKQQITFHSHSWAWLVLEQLYRLVVSSAAAGGVVRALADGVAAAAKLPRRSLVFYQAGKQCFIAGWLRRIPSGFPHKVLGNLGKRYLAEHTRCS